MLRLYEVTADKTIHCNARFDCAKTIINPTAYYCVVSSLEGEIHFKKFILIGRIVDQGTLKCLISAFRSCEM